ncbi:hypothetical protein [Fimbriimonas ginsengisoli]|nr:hypothetical protein [Fimbriimonas ginsengisoli]
MIELRRRVMEVFTARQLGTLPRSPRGLVSQQRAIAHHGEIHGLPEVHVPAIQDLDPASPTFGAFFFLLDASEFDGGDILG